MKHPNFFIIGAPKCGTTSLAAWLADHPRIFMVPGKEPMFFSKDINYGSIRQFDHYLNLFADAGPEHIAVGEASTHYLFSNVAIPTIEQVFPEARYIAMVRNPIEMVISLFLQYKRTFIEDAPDFDTAWKLMPERREGKCVPKGCSDPIMLDYEAWGRLGSQVKRLLELVPRERVLILVLDDVRENPRREYLRVLEFLGVPDDGRVDFPVYNPARQWRIPAIARLIRRGSQTAIRVKLALGMTPGKGWGIFDRLQGLNDRLNAVAVQKAYPSVEIQRSMMSVFEEEIRLLESLLGRSFDRWFRVFEE